MMMLERPAIIQNELERAEQLAPYECKHGLGCFCEKCAFKKRVAKTLDSMRKKRKENQGDFPPEKGIENTDESPGLNAIGKPYSESYDPKYQVRHRPPSIGRLYAPLKPPSTEADAPEVVVKKNLQVVETPPSYELKRGIQVIEKKGPYELVDAGAEPHVRKFLHQAQEAVRFATELYDAQVGSPRLPRTKEMRDEADLVISAWTKLRRQMREEGEKT